MTDLACPCARTSFRRALVIFNPTAGPRRRQRLAAVLGGLDACGCGYTLFHTGQRGDAAVAARTAGRDGYDLVIAAGGDGTINEVADGLVAADKPIPLALVPLGTANVLAAEIGLGGDPRAAVRAIAGGLHRTVRLGRVGDRHFVLMAGAGVDAAVVGGVSGTLKRRAGRLAYGIEAVRQALGYDFPELAITVDGVGYTARMAVACRARHYGGPFVLAPAADIGSDRLQVVLFGRGGWAAVLRYGVALLLGWLPRLPDVRIVAGTTVTLAGPAGCPVQADGDLIGCLPITITLSPHTLQLVVPSPATAAAPASPMVKRR